MEKVVYGVIGLCLQVANGARAIGMIDENQTKEQNQLCAGLAMFAGVCGGIVLGACLQDYSNDKKKAEEKARKKN